MPPLSYHHSRHCLQDITHNHPYYTLDVPLLVPHDWRGLEDSPHTHTFNTETYQTSETASRGRARRTFGRRVLDISCIVDLVARTKVNLKFPIRQRNMYVRRTPSVLTRSTHRAYEEYELGEGEGVKEYHCSSVAGRTILLKTM
ncbi:hypothetical protein WG66_012958 [Moniliophthora roreri]|nr:hypothetical protein WG66_012958 [Moniliophthora roreri]KAI3619300.1 hypothetical protein WG66_012958 [Moniliophthora roreri]